MSRRMGAEAIAKALGGTKSGGGWSARCPAHNDKKPSLSLSNHGDRVLVHCHAGCTQKSVIEALVYRGLWGKRRTTERRLLPQGAILQPTFEDMDDKSRTDYALKVWNSCDTASNSLVEKYLHSRGINLPAGPNFRFGRALPHVNGGCWPVMVALVRDSMNGMPRAIHRTYLNHDGNGKASIQPEKMMLGPCRGGVVRLAEPESILLIGEGIETCFSAMQATGIPTWAALSSGGLRTVRIPLEIKEVIILADGDPTGEDAAMSCARRLKLQGRTVRVARAPVGSDFNDLLRTAPSLPVGGNS